MNEIKLLIEPHQVQVKGEEILLGVCIENAIMDIRTNKNILENCLSIIYGHSAGLASVQIGNFGSFEVTLNLYSEGKASIFIDGPDFDHDRVQSSAIWIEKDNLKDLISNVLKVYLNQRANQ